MKYNYMRLLFKNIHVVYGVLKRDEIEVWLELFKFCSLILNEINIWIETFSFLSEHREFLNIFHIFLNFIENFKQSFEFLQNKF